MNQAGNESIPRKSERQGNYQFVLETEMQARRSDQVIWRGPHEPPTSTDILRANRVYIHEAAAPVRTLLVQFISNLEANPKA